jgi:PAS domain S-box-containing protein
MHFDIQNTGSCEMILNSLDQGIISVSAKGDVAFINIAASKFLQYDSDEIIGLPIHHMIHHSKPDGETYSKDDCPILKIVNDGTPLEGTDELFWKKDDTSIWVKVYGNPIYQNGNVVGAAISFEERVIKTFKPDKIKLHQFPSENPNPVFLVNVNGLIQYGNVASSTLLGEWNTEVGQILPATDLVAEVEESIKSGLPRDLVSHVGKEIYKFNIKPFPNNNSANVYGYDITKWIKDDLSKETVYSTDKLEN